MFFQLGFAMTEDEIDRFIDNAERELAAADKRIRSVSEALERNRQNISAPAVEAASKRLKEMERQVEYDAGQRVANMSLSVESPADSSISPSRKAFRMNRGLRI